MWSGRLRHYFFFRRCMRQKHVKMARLMLMVAALLVCFGLSATELLDADRKALIESAIRDAKQEASLQSSRTSSTRVGHSLAAFKAAAPQLIEQGKARVLFEDMVRRAERKILQEVVQTSDAEGRAEILAKELLHTPGSVLTEEETAMIYEATGCLNSLAEPGVDCSDPANRDYRTANGVCNNLENPLFGAAGREFRRILPPHYEDGIAQLRGTMQSMKSYSKIVPHAPFRPPYPSARTVSENVVRDRDDEDEGFAHILMQWGQWIDHDLDLAPELPGSDCPPGCIIQTDRCVPIRIASDDPDFSTVFGNPAVYPVCHPFSRSVPSCDSSPPGQMGPRQQLNALTSWIDGSQVYGSSQALQSRLRDGNTAFLRTGPPIPSGGGDSLPRADQSDVAMGFVGCPLDPVSDCFLAGDVRVNEQLGLVAFHTIFVREHNRIAAELQGLNPGLTDEEVFQLTRKIVGAEIQKITYFDYLPALIGTRFFRDNIQSFEDAGGYDPRLDSAVPNAFASAAYRYGHSQIQPVWDRLDENLQPISRGPLDLVDSFFNPSEFEAGGGTDPLLRGLLTQPARTVDVFLNSILTTQLFANDDGLRFDLASLNIQRARDHGIPPYMIWKKWATRACEETSDFRNELTYIRLLQTYGSLDTVDLWVGGLAEQPVRGGLVGATFACIFANTFAAIRNGDRFYFENCLDGPPDPQDDAIFTTEQSEQILRTSLSRIICDNADGIESIRRNAFRLRSAQRDCSQLQRVNLDVFANPMKARSQNADELIHSLEDALAQDKPNDEAKENANEKLIALLEEYTHELKGDSNEVKQDNQAHLFSDLEDALNDIEEYEA